MPDDTSYSLSLTEVIASERTVDLDCSAQPCHRKAPLTAAARAPSHGRRPGWVMTRGTWSTQPGALWRLWRGEAPGRGGGPRLKAGWRVRPIQEDAGAWDSDPGYCL